MWGLYAGSNHEQPPGEQTATSPARLGAAVMKHRFYSSVFHHRLRSNQRERGERQRMWQGEEQASPPRAAALQPLGKVGWHSGPPRPPLPLSTGRRRVVWIAHPADGAGCRPGAPLPFGTVPWIAICTWMGVPSVKAWEITHGTLPTVKPNWGALLGLLVKMLKDLWVSGFFPSLFCSTE